MQKRNQWSVPNVKRVCDVYIYRIKFRMLEVRENEIALRKMSGGTAQLRTLEGTLASTHSAFHWWSTQCAAHVLLFSYKLSCFVVGTNGCLNFRHCAFALDGQVHTEWSRCPGSKAQCARDSMIAWWPRSSFLHCCVNVIMLPSGYFISPHLALGAICDWDPWCTLLK